MTRDALHYKRWLLGGIQRLGYHVQSFASYRPVDLRNSSESPITLHYRHPGRKLLIDAPVVYGRGLICHPFPHGVALSAAIGRAFREPAQAETLIDSALERFYRDWQPASAADYLGLDALSCPALAELPPWLSPWPWEALGLQQKWLQRQNTERRESARELGEALPIEQGWKYCGPVSPAKRRVETRRLVKLLASIRRDGIRRHDGPDGDIRAVLMCREDGQWRWLVISGQHRYAVLSSLGKFALTVRIEQLVRREDVTWWPGVVNGTFTPEAARRVFDSLFDAESALAGRSAPVAEEGASCR